jgi:hypothetical protein
MIRKTKLAAALVLLTLTSIAPAYLQAEDIIEKAGVATGVTVGNTIAVPLKAVTMALGALSGVLSFIVTGGNTELTQQIWQDTFQGPYVVTPELARMSVGQRPELELKK